MKDTEMVLILQKINILAPVLHRLTHAEKPVSTNSRNERMAVQHARHRHKRLNWCQLESGCLAPA